MQIYLYLLSLNYAWNLESLCSYTFFPCGRHTDQKFILSLTFTWCGTQGDLFYSLILDVLKLQKMEKKRCFQLCQYKRITILKHNWTILLEEHERTYTMTPAGLSRPSSQLLHQGIPGRQPTYLPQVVVQPNVLGMLAKAVFPALCSGAPTYPATERTEGVG